MQPAKVYLGQNTGSYLAEAPQAAGSGNLTLAKSPESSGEWVNAVMQTAPVLDQQGIQEAINILDTALSNVQHLKAIDNYIANATQTIVGSVSYGAAEVMRAQVNERQQILLHRLHRLGNRCAAAKADFKRPGLPASALDQAISSAAPSMSPAQLDLYLGALMSQYVPMPMPMPMGPMMEPNPYLGAMQPNHAQASKPRLPRQVQTLSTSLQMLSKEDPNTLLIVRRINKLGFKGAKKLKTHFSQYGQVNKVLVAHSTCRQNDDAPCQARRRPSSLGFVHMASAESVQKVLALGAEQLVEGAMIRVQKFERQHGEAAIAEDEDEEDGHDKDWLRQPTGNSNTSTNSGSVGSSVSNAGSD